jgi:hypothetical protein
MPKKITAKNYRKDPYYRRVADGCTQLLLKKGFVAPVELFMEMGLLRKADHDNWRNGRVPYLEKVIQCNLGKCSRIMRILAKHGASANLKPSWTYYRKWGKGVKTKLRFTKTGDRNIEDAYATHYVASEETRKKIAAAAKARAAKAQEAKSEDTAPQPDFIGTRLVKKPSPQDSPASSSTTFK